MFAPLASYRTRIRHLSGEIVTAREERLLTVLDIVTETETIATVEQLIADFLRTLRLSGKEEAHMKETLEVHVGNALEDTGRRFIDAWHCLGDGKRVHERHLSFESLEGLLMILTPKRWQLLKYVHNHPVRSVRALSVQLKRDYRRVHDDVEALVTAGLLVRDGRGMRADYDGIDSTFRFDSHSHE